MLVIDERFKEEILSELNKLRNESILCDVTLHIEGKDFAAHRCVLSVASPYFRALFTCEFKLRENERNRIELQSITCTAAKEVLDFIYTGQASVDSANAHDLFRAADYLIIPSLKSKVATFLEEIIDATNCLLLESFGSQLNCESLEKAAIAYKLQHFVAVTKSEDFKALDFEKVKQLICHDEIINRAAMGRARFLLYTGFIYFFLLTARPWAERGSCFTRDLLFFFLSVTRRKPPLGQIVFGALKSRNL